MRRGSRNRGSGLARFWDRTGPTARLGYGMIIVVALWWIGLDTVVVAGVQIPWPIGLLVAAMGWARVGLAMRPMLALIALSLLFDLGANAPFGSYMIVALTTYGVHAAAESALDLEHDPVLQGVLPFLSLFAGLLVLWTLASVGAGHFARLAPLVLTGFATALVFGALAPVFHLRMRPGALAGRA
ncbi:MAG: hypothetical protein AAFX86_07855 [Pseudomonadota bacterium]